MLAAQRQVNVGARVVGDDHCQCAVAGLGCGAGRYRPGCTEYEDGSECNSENFPDAWHWKPLLYFLAGRQPPGKFDVCSRLVETLPDGDAWIIVLIVL